MTMEVVSSLLVDCIVPRAIYSFVVLMGSFSDLEKANPADVLVTTMGTRIGNNIYICLFCYSWVVSSNSYLFLWIVSIWSISATVCPWKATNPVFDNCSWNRNVS